MKNGDDFVKPPEFPEDDVTENKPELTLNSEESDKIEPPVYPDPPEVADAAESVQEEVADAAENVPDDTGMDSADAASGKNDVVIENETASGSNSSKEPGGGYVNLTQQKINEQNQRRQQTYNQNFTQQDNYSSAQNNNQNNSGNFGGGNGNNNGGINSFFNKFSGRDASGHITGTPGLIISIIALALVVIFGLIGTCGGGFAVSLVFVIIGIILSIVGIVISNKNRRETNDTCQYAKTAFVMSLIALVLGVILLIIGISCVGCFTCLACRGINAISQMY